MEIPSCDLSFQENHEKSEKSGKSCTSSNNYISVDLIKIKVMFLSIPAFFQLQLIAYQYHQPVLGASNNGSLPNEFSVISSIGIFPCSVLTLLGLTEMLKQHHTALVRSIMKQVMEGINQCRKIDICMYTYVCIYVKAYKSVNFSISMCSFIFP